MREKHTTMCDVSMHKSLCYVRFIVSDTDFHYYLDVLRLCSKPTVVLCGYNWIHVNHWLYQNKFNTIIYVNTCISCRTRS